jgi:hypothetical protein
VTWTSIASVVRLDGSVATSPWPEDDGTTSPALIGRVADRGSSVFKDVRSCSEGVCGDRVGVDGVDSAGFGGRGRSSTVDSDGWEGGGPSNPVDSDGGGPSIVDGWDDARRESGVPSDLERPTTCKDNK